jgi:hypothetical protein
MGLLGQANWWLPGWLERLLPAERPDRVTEPAPEPTSEAAEVH